MSLSLEGQMLGKYRVLEPLGRGGMARVYRAYHPQLDRYVAIKVLRSDLVEEEAFLARFRREAQAVARLRHTHIVQVYDFDVQGGLPYMVMELLEGDTLKACLNSYRQQGKHMPLAETVRVLLDVLDGLAYAHDEGMIHRDIKPANILLTCHSHAVLSDFGIAQIVGGTQYTVSGALLGTLNYMAPEQGLEGRCDARSDIYALGVVLYEMLTQSIPFDADTPLAILMKHLNDPLPLPRQIEPTIPEPFERIVLKAMAKQPEDRYPSAGEMAQALRSAATQTGIDVPAHISLGTSPGLSERKPGQPSATAGVPSESAAVFSGTARAEIMDDRFAKDDTFPTPDQQVETAFTPSERRTRVADRPRPQLFDALLKQGVWPGQIRPATAILGAVGIGIVYNLVAVWVGGATGWWGLFGRGWPVELLLVSLVLCAIMYAASSIWLLIPAGIVLGNGILFAYYAVTGYWRHWAFLWPLEPLVIAGSIVLPLWLARRPAFARQLSRPLGCALGLVAILWSLIAVLGTMLTALIG